MANIFHVERAANKITLGTVGTTINVASHTASLLLSLDASKNLKSVTDLTSWIAGTANQIVVTDDTDGTITLSTPQDIHTGASPTFAGLTLSSVANEATDVDKFLVDSTGVIKYRTGAEVLSDIGGQASDASLTSIAALTYVSASFIKLTAEDTYAVRTIAETKSDLSLNLVENIAHSTDAHTMTIDGRDVSVDGSKLDGVEALADVTATNETSHADVVVDGDFTSNGILNRTGAGVYSILALGTDVQAYHANLAAIAGGTWTGAASITTLGTIATGIWEATDVAILHGGTGQSTAQAAIDALSAVGGATNEHVLTKDTATGNATWKAATGDTGQQTQVSDATDEIPIAAGNNTYEDIDAMTLTPTFVGGKVLILFEGTYRKSSNSIVTFAINVDGADVQEISYYDNAATTVPRKINIHWLVTAGLTGAKVVKMRWKCAIAADTRFMSATDNGARTLTVIEF